MMLRNAKIKYYMQINMVDSLEDQLLEEKARLMSMLEYISRSDLESQARPQEGFVVLNKTQPRPLSGPPNKDDPGNKLRRPSQTYASLIREVRKPHMKYKLKEREGNKVKYIRI